MPIIESEDSGVSWRTASYSVGNGACIQVASALGKVLLRDSKDPEGPVLSYSAAAFRSFLDATKRAAS